MNVLFLEGDMSRQGGTERMTALLANALCKENTVWVISLRFHGNTVFFALDDRVRHSALHPASGRPGILRQIREIRRFVRSNHVDRVINVDVGMGIYGVPAVWGTKARAVTWEHGNFFNNWNSGWFPHFRRFAAKHSDAMVVLTERDRDNYLSHIRTRKPVVTIPNPALRHPFRYDSASKTILSAGLLQPIKGYDKAVQAAAKVLPRHPDWRWVICGEGVERPRLENLIAEAGLEKQVLLPGTVSDMDERYRSAALYVMTSEMEGLPMVLLEAKSWGLPIVSFDVMTGPSDVVRDGVNGYLVPSGDTDALAEKLEELIGRPEQRERFSRDSQLDMERFDFERILQKWQEVLEAV